jgi:hypothetical protein
MSDSNQFTATSFAKDKFKNVYNSAMSPYRSAKMTTAKYTSPIQNFFHSLEGKYSGAIFSLMFILLFTFVFKSMVRRQENANSATVEFIAGSVQTCLIILMLIIVLQLF